MAPSNTPSRLRRSVWRFAKHHPDVYAMREGRTIILAVVFLLPPAPCPGHAVCFIMKAKALCLGLQKKTQLEISG